VAHLWHLSRCERTQQNFSTSAMGSKPPLAAQSMKVRCGPEVSVPASRISLPFLCNQLGQDIADNFKRSHSCSVVMDHASHQKLVGPVLFDDRA
jgi:hypothetical protein